MSISPIKKMEELAKSLPGVISLGQGIPAGHSSDLIRNEVIKAMNNNKVDRYSQVAGIQELRDLLEVRLKDEGFNYRAEDEIIITAGAMEALAVVVLSMVGEGDEVIVISPCYSYYERMVKMAKGKVVYEALDEDNDWGLDIESLQSKVTDRTKLLVICDPNNPTGSVLPEAQLKQLGDLAIKYNFLIISDEVYKNLLFMHEPLVSLAKMRDYRDQVIRIVSFSKDFNMTGWRVGYINCPTNIYNKLMATHDTLVNCTPVISQYAALAALKFEDQILGGIRHKYEVNKDIVIAGLRELGDKVSFVEPKGTYYIFPRIQGLKDSTEFCMRLLQEAKLALVPGAAFGEGGEGHVRICFGRDSEDVKEGMRRLVNFLKL